MVRVGGLSRRSSRSEGGSAVRRRQKMRDIGWSSVFGVRMGVMQESRSKVIDLKQGLAGTVGGGGAWSEAGGLVGNGRKCNHESAA